MLIKPEEASPSYGYMAAVPFSSTDTYAPVDSFICCGNPNDHVKNTFVHLPDMNFDIDLTLGGPPTCPAGVGGGSTPLERSVCCKNNFSTAVAASLLLRSVCCSPKGGLTTDNDVMFLVEEGESEESTLSTPLLLPQAGLLPEVRGVSAAETEDWHSRRDFTTTAAAGAGWLSVELNRIALATPKDPSTMAYYYQNAVGADQELVNNAVVSPESPTITMGKKKEAGPEKKKEPRPPLLLPVVPRSLPAGIEPHRSGAAAAAAVSDQLVLPAGARWADVYDTPTNDTGDQIMELATIMPLGVAEEAATQTAPIPLAAVAAVAAPPPKKEKEQGEGWEQPKKITSEKKKKQRQPKSRGGQASSGTSATTTTAQHAVRRALAPSDNRGWKKGYTDATAPQPSQDYEYTKYLCRFPVQIKPEVEGGFHVFRRIVGPGGENMKKINRMTSAKLRLRGIGSGFKELPNNKEAKVPLELDVSADDRTGYLKAIEMVGELLEKVYRQYRAHCTRVGLCEKRYPRNLTMKLEEHPDNPTTD